MFCYNFCYFLLSSQINNSFTGTFLVYFYIFGSRSQLRFTFSFSTSDTFSVHVYNINISLWWTIPTKSVVPGSTMAFYSTELFKFPALATFGHQAISLTLAMAQFPPRSTKSFTSLCFWHNFMLDTLIVNSYWCSVKLWTWSYLVCTESPLQNCILWT